MNKTSEEIFLLLDNLLKWAKNRLKKQNVYKQETDINSLVSSTAEIYIPMATQKRTDYPITGHGQRIIRFC